jgi:hypothetical protein
MNTQNGTDPFRAKFEEARAKQEAQAVEMEFAGFPCKVIPLPYSVFLTSGRMPEYLTDIVLAEPSEKAAAAREPTAQEVKDGEEFRCKAVCRVMVWPRILNAADYAAEAERRRQWGADLEAERAIALARAKKETERAEIEGRFEERAKAEEDSRPPIYLYADVVETAPALVSALFQWIMRGCPMPKKEGESERLDAEALANFPDKKRPSKRARARDNSKGRGPKSVAASTQ